MLSAWKAEDFLYTLFSVMPNSRYLRSSALGAGACILDIAGISRHRSVNGACSCYESSPSGTQVLYHPDLLDKYLQVHGIDTTASFERHASILQHAHRDSPSTSDPESLHYLNDANLETSRYLVRYLWVAIIVIQPTPSGLHVATSRSRNRGSTNACTIRHTCT
jgi:hypothetical protein